MPTVHEEAARICRAKRLTGAAAVASGAVVPLNGDDYEVVCDPGTEHRHALVRPVERAIGPARWIERTRLWGARP
jgi:hypothetical protein